MIWAKQLIQELVKQGVCYFCIAPGSRSTPLTLAACEHPLVETFVHFDERGLGFHALGYGKATGNPAVIIVTSGTAVGNLLPSVMEAHSSHIPMLLLTADRPPELRDCGANQTTHQVGIFSSFVRWQCDFPCANENIAPSFIGSTIANACSHAINEPAGPVHLNCMLREPFFSSENESDPRSFKTKISIGEKTLSECQLQALANQLSQHEKGVIIASDFSARSSYDPLMTLSKLLKWPIFPDILSPTRAQAPQTGVISTFDLILHGAPLNEDFFPDAILQLGDRFVSKKLFEWIEMKKPKFYGHVATHPWRMDPLHALTHKIVAKPWQVIEGLVKHLSERRSSSWAQYWERMDDLTQTTLVHFFKQNQELSEPYLFHVLPCETPLFLGNSLPIRSAESFFHASVGPIFGNRGVSGIDGNIGTCVGIANGLKKPLLSIMGDLTFLHDLTSLDQLRQSSVPITLLVINNDGGGIFSFLPIAKKSEAFAPFFATPHGLDLSHAAALFELDYTLIETKEHLHETLTNKHGKSRIIEMRTNRDAHVTLHQEIISHLKEILSHPSLTSLT